jgi:hypothetical protein
MPTPVSNLMRPSSARRVLLDGFVPVPRGTMQVVPLPLMWPAKDPGDVLDYELDLSPAMDGSDGDRLATVDVTITPGEDGAVTLSSSAADGMRVVLWLAGGQANVVYSVQVTVTTALGRTLSRAVLLPVLGLAAAAPPPVSALTTEAGVTITDANGNPILVGS